MTDALRDQNHVTVALGVSSTDDSVTLPFKIDPATGRLLTDAAAGGYTNLTQFVDQTAWRLFYSNTDGDVIELAFGASGTVLQSNGASAAPTFGTAGAGDVSAAANLGDNLLIRGDGAGKGVQNSGISIDDTNNVTGMANLTATGVLLSGLTASEIVITDASKNLVSAAVATYPNLTELSYVKGVTSAIQTQFTSKAPLVSPTFTGTVTLPSTFTIGSNNFVRSGAHSLTFTTTATTNVTLPVSGTLATLIGTETFANKTLTAPNINSPIFTDVTGIPLDVVPDVDETASGYTTGVVNAGTTIAKFEAVYLGSGGKWLLTDASATATADKLIAIALEAGTDTNPLEVALPGSSIRDDTWAWTVGGAIYLSETAGVLTQTAPTATDAVVRVLGYALTADIMWFQPETGVVHT